MWAPAAAHRHPADRALPEGGERVGPPERHRGGHGKWHRTAEGAQQALLDLDVVGSREPPYHRDVPVNLPS
jgi:hypothetical protein